MYELHPIQDAASTRSRTLPLLLSLALTPLLIYGLSLSLDTSASLQGIRMITAPLGRSVSLLLTEVDSPASGRAPVRNLVGTEGPGGLGHREGTDTLDPRLSHLQVTTLSTPSEVVDPETLGPSPKAERAFLSLNPALPIQAGGNGLSRGTGKDPALGTGGLVRPPTPVPVRDLQLVPTRQVQVSHSLARGESGSTQQAVRIRILIGEDGVPYEASVVSGPPFLYEEALKAARGWRFEPLAKHGLKAPVSIVLIFKPSLLPRATHRAS